MSPFHTKRLWTNNKEYKGLSRLTYIAKVFVFDIFKCQSNDKFGDCKDFLFTNLWKIVWASYGWLLSYPRMSWMRGTAAAMKLLAVMVLPLGQVQESMLRGRPSQGGELTEVGVKVEPSLEGGGDHTLWYKVFWLYWQITTILTHTDFDKDFAHVKGYTCTGTGWARHPGRRWGCCTCSPLTQPQRRPCTNLFSLTAWQDILGDWHLNVAPLGQVQVSGRAPLPQGLPCPSKSSFLCWDYFEENENGW